MLPIRVSTGWNVPLDKPGQTRTGRPIVPLSLCPGTKQNSCPGDPLSQEAGAYVPGQTPL